MKMDTSYAAVNIITWILLVFKCVLVVSDGPLMDTAEITVKVNEREMAILPCMVQHINFENAALYKVVWMSPDMQLLTIGTDRITTNSRITVSRPSSTVWNLQISTVRAEDAGAYQCQINTQPVMQKKTVKLLVYVRPRISVSPTVKSVEGRELRMFCNVTGIPRPSVQWFREGKVLANQTEELFTIKVVSRTDAGDYTCKASNEVDTDEKTVNVVVYYPPTVSAHNTRIGQELGKQAVLECQAIGNPPGTFNWYHDGELKTSWRYEIQTFGHEGDRRTLSLQVRSVTEDDYGEYVCSAENQLGRDQVVITLYDSRNAPTTKPSNEAWSFRANKEHCFAAVITCVLYLSFNI